MNIKNTKEKLALGTMIVGTTLMSVSTKVSAEVRFDDKQAMADVKALLNPISNFIIGIAVLVTLVSVGGSYISYMQKDEEEKQQTPFHKTIKKHVYAFVLLGLVGAALKWFSIS